MAHKKGSDFGSVYYRSDRDRWMVQYYEYDPITGKRIHREKTFKTQEEGQEYLRSIMIGKESEAFIESQGITLKEIMTNILNKKFEYNLISEAQYERVERTQRRMFENPLLSKDILDISPEELQDFVNSYRELSDSSIKKVFEQLNQAFKYALERGYIPRSPMPLVLRPKSNKQKSLIRAMTIDEENKFVDYLKNKTLEECPYKNEYLMQLFMGLRIGECLALTHHDIDLANKQVRINKTLTRDVRGIVSMGETTKTVAGQRILPIPKVIYPYIIEQMRFSDTQEGNDDKLLFKPKFNKYTTPENVNRALDKILKELDIEHMASHSLRHTYATRCIEAGVTPVVLQRLMGHTDVSVTLNTYTSVFDEYKETELNKVNAYYEKENLLSHKEIPKQLEAKDDYDLEI